MHEHTEHIQPLYFRGYAHGTYTWLNPFHPYKIAGPDRCAPTVSPVNAQKQIRIGRSITAGIQYSSQPAINTFHRLRNSMFNQIQEQYVIITFKHAMRLLQYQSNERLSISGYSPLSFLSSIRIPSVQYSRSNGFISYSSFICNSSIDDARK